MAVVALSNDKREICVPNRLVAARYPFTGIVEPPGCLSLLDRPADFGEHTESDRRQDLQEAAVDSLLGRQTPQEEPRTGLGYGA
ncbi:hypothetical protein QW131_13495 [Roseibium salinum]|nr:hypothetical protein [Roseibium salinum]